MPNFHTRTIKPNRAGGTRSIIIQGKPVPVVLAKITYLCIHCLAKLKERNAGLVCSDNQNHYGFIHRDEASQLTDEERFMKIGDMFPGEFLRGIDIHEPLKVKVLSVKAEQHRGRDGGKLETVYLMYFEGMSKGLILNLTNAKEAAIFLGSDDTDHWIGKWVTLYRVIDKFFGKTHIVVRIREPKQSDKVLSTGKEKPLNKFSKTELVNKAKNELSLSPELIGFTLKAAKLVNGGAWQSEKVPQMWQELEATGVALHNFIQLILSDITFYGDEKSVLHFLAERNIIFEPGEDNETGLYNLLDQYARQQADLAAMGDDEAEQIAMGVEATN